MTEQEFERELKEMFEMMSLCDARKLHLLHPTELAFLIAGAGRYGLSLMAERNELRAQVDRLKSGGAQ